MCIHVYTMNEKEAINSRDNKVMFTGELRERKKMGKFIYKDISLLNHLSLQIVKRKIGEDMETIFSRIATTTVGQMLSRGGQMTTI